jgi:hypothetical protein
MPDPDDWKDENREPGCTKTESQIWKELKNYKNGIKTNGETGSKARFYEWDFLHNNEIEVYGPGGRERLGAMCPKTGRMIQEPHPGRNIRKKVN